MSHSQFNAARSDSTPLITLHWLERSRAQRILMLLEENEPGPTTIEGNSPTWPIPIITIGDRTIAESALIVEYFSEHFGSHLIPSKWKTGREGKIGGETEEYMRYRYFMHYCEGSLMPWYLVENTFERFAVSRRSKNTHRLGHEDNKEYINTNFATNFAFLEEQLSSAPNGGPYLCGATLTGADIMMVFPVLLATSGWRNLDVDKARFPKLFGYAEALKEIESYRKAEGEDRSVGGRIVQPRRDFRMGDYKAQLFVELRRRLRLSFNIFFADGVFLRRSAARSAHVATCADLGVDIDRHGAEPNRQSGPSRAGACHNTTSMPTPPQITVTVNPATRMPVFTYLLTPKLEKGLDVASKTLRRPKLRIAALSYKYCTPERSDWVNSRWMSLLVVTDLIVIRLAVARGLGGPSAARRITISTARRITIKSTTSIGVDRRIAY
ncbi:hypothetical protein C8F04DRAFT_1235152 [Mycena alexandri]|uniref:GST C-terminal domain-containing protein n=1 Tax=Mycena alexandri TaxID=1745969 RepID=A0AAD6SUP9_9AGAR|nr:hypothetical protein C8F04DRAFT_1235152 [Mycena alexandri]